MSIKPKSFLLPVLLATLAAASNQSQETKIQGVLIDKHCSYQAETRVVPGPRLEGGIITAYNHTRQCNLLTECRRSGYGVFAYETDKFVPFDEAGNQKALTLLKTAAKGDDFRVEVSGKMHGDTLEVSTIKLLP